MKRLGAWVQGIVHDYELGALFAFRAVLSTTGFLVGLLYTSGVVSPLVFGVSVFACIVALLGVMFTAHWAGLPDSAFQSDQ